MEEGSVLAIHSTIGIKDCRKVADAGAERGVSVIDAPVSGGGAAAAVGKLTVYLGGDLDAVARARPVLETYGDPVFHLGELGAGLRVKLFNNPLNAAHFALAHDVMALGIESGLDPGVLGDALRNGSGRSFSLDVYIAMGSFDVFADQVGPIMSKDVGLFAQETDDAPQRAVLLQAADRFVELLGYRRSVPIGDSA
jgi:3-hydroxyisobutyrate dehydrogenase-like beta-hydroxyacid dehydrogenase